MKSDERSWISTIPTGEPPQSLDEQTKILVNMVFARFKASYGHRFDSTFGDGESLNIAKREWGFCLLGYSEEQLAHALHTAKLKYPWPPSIAEFLALMQPSPEDYGMPPTRSAYLEASSCRENPRDFPWSHVAVYEAARLTGFWRLKTASEKESWPLFEKHYLQTVRQVMNGEEFFIPDHIQLEDKSSLTLALDIQELSEQNDIDPSFFYYLHKPGGSSVRAQMRKSAQDRLKAMDIHIVLPE